MRIQFKPYNAIAEVVHINSIALEKQYAGISVWRMNEIKNLPDSLVFRENRDGQITYRTLVDDLLSNVNFQRVDTIKETK